VAEVKRPFLTTKTCPRGGPKRAETLFLGFKVFLAMLMSSVKKTTQRAHAFFQRCLERTYKNMKFSEILLQNMTFFQALKS